MIIGMTIHFDGKDYRIDHLEAIRIGFNAMVTEIYGPGVHLPRLVVIDFAGNVIRK